MRFFSQDTTLQLKKSTTCFDYGFVAWRRL